METLADLFVRHRLAVAIGLIAISSVAAYGIWGPAWEARLRGQVAVSDEIPRRERPENIVARGAQCQLVIESPRMFAPQTIAAYRRVSQAVRRLDVVTTVTGIEQVPVFGPLGLPEPLLPANGASPRAFARARQRALKHPLIAGQLLSADARTMIVLVGLNESAMDNGIPRAKRLKMAFDKIRRAARDAASSENLRIRLTGRLPLIADQNEAFTRDRRKFTLIANVLVFLMAGLMFRRLSAILIVSLASMLGLFWATGALALLGEEQNQLTAVIMPVLLTMIGFTDGVHLMLDLRRARAGGLPPVEAARHSFEHLGIPCFLTSLTTAIGFSSLGVADSPLIRSFGLSCALGVVLTFAAVVTFIPLAGSTWIGRKIHLGHEHDIVHKNLDLFHGIIDFVLRHARAVTVTAIVVTALLSLTALTLRPDNRLASDFPPKSESYQTLAHCDQALGGIRHVQILVDWPATVDVTGVLAALATAQSVLSESRLVRHPFSLRNLLEALPGTGDHLAGRMKWLKLMPEALVARLYRPDLRHAVIDARVQDLGIARYEPVYARIDSGLDGLQHQFPGFRFKLTGDPVSGAREASRIIHDLAKSLGAAAAIILVVVGVVYRSLRIGLISVIPNLFPLAVTATILVLWGRPLEITSVCAFTICLGIAVDDTIHFLSRFRRELRVDGHLEAAVRRSFIGVGTALVMTTLILVAGFSTILTSRLPNFRLFGAMCCSTIGAALIGDLIILPAMICVFLHPRAVDQVSADESNSPPAVLTTMPEAR